MILKKWSGALLAGISLALGVIGGYWLAHQGMRAATGTAPEQNLNSPDERKALYWYDPMYPQQKFDKPGKSPFMDMQLVRNTPAAVATVQRSVSIRAWPRISVCVLRRSVAGPLIPVSM
jgi:Cu(I)/Ag(I) efflux system membrane fusion protein